MDYAVSAVPEAQGTHTRRRSVESFRAMLRIMAGCRRALPRTHGKRNGMGYYMKSRQWLIG